MKDMQAVRVRLSYMWFSFSGIIFLILLIQSINDPDVAKTIWAWFTPLVLPGTGLIVGLWIAVAQLERKPTRLNEFTASLSYGIVVFYFFCLFATILAEPFVSSSLSDWLETSQLWVGIVQAPTLAIIGKVFAEN